jgi:UDP-N-acetylmuramate: L-alanyl-gamma-D-glutamyl-meso-diaminopimelate ligase
VVIGGSHGKTTITAMVLHVLHQYNLLVDYMVGALLTGFDTMVNLTHQNTHIVLEGDEYLSSPIDLRPKFHHYKPHVALLSGIAWDHINVFKTFEDYVKQFSIFIESIQPNGTLVYNETDVQIRQLVAQIKRTDIALIPYTVPDYWIDINGDTHVSYADESYLLQIFGEHNLLNLDGARLICKQWGLSNTDFLTAIQSFKGASRRLERMQNNTDTQIKVFRDFAHAPSKVKATVEAVVQQFTNQITVGCLELHTYSSLNPEFLPQYKDCMKGLTHKMVFYDVEALRIKNMAIIQPQDIVRAFGDSEIQVFNEKSAMKAYLKSLPQTNAVYLMSSGNFSGIDLSRWPLV